MANQHPRSQPRVEMEGKTMALKSFDRPDSTYEVTLSDMSISGYGCEASEGMNPKTGDLYKDPHGDVYIICWVKYLDDNVVQFGMMVLEYVKSKGMNRSEPRVKIEIYVTITLTDKETRQMFDSVIPKDQSEHGMGCMYFGDDPPKLGADYLKGDCVYRLVRIEQSGVASAYELGLAKVA